MLNVSDINERWTDCSASMLFDYDSHSFSHDEDSILVAKIIHVCSSQLNLLNVYFLHKFVFMSMVNIHYHKYTPLRTRE